MNVIRTNCTLIISRKDNRVIEIISDYTLYKDEQFHTNCDNPELYTVRARFASHGTVKAPGYRMSRTNDGQYFVHPMNNSKSIALPNL